MENIIEMAYFDRSFYFREGNFGDLYTISENLRRRPYGGLNFGGEDIVLDLGGHIGTFAVAVASKVKEVISVEMDVECFALLKRNTEFYDNITIVNLACVSQRSTESSVLEYKAGKNSGANSLWVKRGRGAPIAVGTVRITELFERFHPSIIKCDVEGSEYDILSGLQIPESVGQIGIEFHFGKKGWRDAANAIRNALVKQGFMTTFVDYAQNKRWTQIAYFKRS